MARRFNKQIKDWTKKYARRLDATAQIAAQELISNAQRVRKDGGAMPVDTGFLRASIGASTEGMPYGPTINPKNRNYPIGSQVYGEPVALALLHWSISSGETLHVGWTANYARYMEAYYGFVDLAVQKWEPIVEKAARKVRRAGI